MNEVHVVATTLSVDFEIPYDILATLGASAALTLSEIPFLGPIGSVHVGRIDGQLVINPTLEELQDESDLDLVVTGTADAIAMVEAGAQEVSEATIVEALRLAHDEIKKLVDVQLELQKLAGKPKWDVPEYTVDEAILEQVRSGFGAAFDAATQVHDKKARQDATSEVKESAVRSASGRGPRPRARRPGAPRRRQVREGHDPRADRRQEDAPRRPRRRRGPADHVRSGAHPAHARQRPLHARRDAGPEHRHAGRHRRVPAHRRPRHRGQEALHPPLQLPAVLGGGDRLHARPQAPRHRPRRSRRARPGAGPAGRGRVPLHDPHRVGDPREQRLVLDGERLRQHPVAHGRRRADQASGGRHRDGPHQGGR